MKRPFHMATLVLTLLATCAGAADVRPPDRLFVQAAEAYDQRDFHKAQTCYAEIQAQGLVAPELYFNLGNTYMRLGQWGQAILSYRRAHALAPRDPDLASNLRFALDLAGALTPAPPPWQKIREHLNRGEWMTCALACYWVAALLVAIHLLLPRRPRWCLRLAFMALCGFAVAAAALFDLHRWQTDPEAVILAPDVQSLFAPLESATAHFRLPEGSVVRIRERAGDWVKVEAGGKSGWIRQSACEAVWPLR